jgi:hypothetical protein
MAALGINPADSDELKKEIAEQTLSRADYGILLAEQFWDLACIPFFLPGYKIFKTEIDMKEDLQKGLFDTVVLGVFCRLFSAIRNGALQIAEGSCPINIPIDIDIRQLDGFIFKRLLNDFTENTNMCPVVIETFEVIKWCIFQDVSVGEILLDVLGVHKNEKKSERGALSNSEINRIRFLSAAQVLWHLSPSKNKSNIFKDPILRHYGPKNGYSESRAYSLLSLIDPSGPKRDPGRPKLKGLEVSRQEFGLRPIPDVCFGEEYKIDMKKAKIIVQTIVEVCNRLQIDDRLNNLKEHPLLKIYFPKPHRIIENIVEEWISEARHKSSSGFPTTSDEDLLDEYLLRLRVNLAVPAYVPVESLSEEMKADILRVARYFEKGQAT